MVWLDFLDMALPVPAVNFPFEGFLGTVLNPFWTLLGTVEGVYFKFLGGGDLAN